MYGIAVTIFVIICLGIVGIIVWKKRGLIFRRSEKRTQVYFGDNGTILLRVLNVLRSFLVEKPKGEPSRAWRMYYKLLKDFDGYAGMKPDKVTLSYSRNTVLDPFNELDDDEKIEDISEIAEAQCYHLERIAHGSVLMNNITIALACIVGLFAIVIAVQVLT